MWKLSATTPASNEGDAQRVHRTVGARNAREAGEELAMFVAEVRAAGPPRPEAGSLRVDEAIEQFLTEHLRDEKGREEKTVRDYRLLHRKWFSPAIGQRLVRDVDEAAVDRVFGAMRRAGLSRSRLNQAKSLYMPFFRWPRASTCPSSAGPASAGSLDAIPWPTSSCPPVPTCQRSGCRPRWRS